MADAVEVFELAHPVAEHRGKVQKMTLENGQPKGMQRVLVERGFNVAKLGAKCSPVCPNIENTIAAWLVY